MTRLAARGRQARTGPRRHVDKYKGAASRPLDARWHFNSHGVMKRPFDQAGAESAAAERSEQSGLDIRAYPCRTCPSWHIGQFRR